MRGEWLKVNEPRRMVAVAVAQPNTHKPREKKVMQSKEKAQARTNEMMNKQQEMKKET